MISAHGVGGNVSTDANLGITLMRGLYLKSTYQEKWEQERLVSEHPVPSRIWRPRVLSFAPIPMNPVATPRAFLARDVLDWVEGGRTKDDVLGLTLCSQSEGGSSSLRSRNGDPI